MPPNNKLQKFCKLSKYIQQIDKDFFEVFDNLCIGHYLKPVRGASGITLLFPKEKSYRQKIINAAYSKDPEVAVNMIKALVLQGHYPSHVSLNQGAVNLLNQKVSVASVSDKGIKLEGGLELKIDDSFKPLYHDNMAVYHLSGKGEMPLNGPAAVADKKIPVSGGGSSCAKKNLQKLLEKVYISEIGNLTNIYAKKVYLQLKFISSANATGVLDFLGNDEFSDSYLLDMYCEKNHPQCFGAINDAMAEVDNLAKITHANYVALKAEVIAANGGTGNNGPKDTTRLNNIQSPMDIRQRVTSLYGGDKKRICKDLFIVFCNISRDLWSTDAASADAFKNFSYLACHVYDDGCESLLSQEFDIARDLTLYGNLLKSDVFMYSPQASFTASEVSLPIPASLPSPLDMRMYSLCGLINKPTEQQISGGGRSFLYEGL